jgi:hypothetical protein
VQLGSRSDTEAHWSFTAQKKEGKSTEKSVSTPDAPPSSQHPEALPPKQASTVSSSAEEELKILEFKSWKGMLKKGEKRQLAELKGVGGSTGTVGPGSGTGDPAEG